MKLVKAIALFLVSIRSILWSVILIIFLTHWILILTDNIRKRLALTRNPNRVFGEIVK